MEHTNHTETVDCEACATTTSMRPPNKSFIGMIVAFWVSSAVLGFATAVHGWGVLAALSWAFFASAVVLFARRATSWTCAECGSAVAPPVHARTYLPKAGAYRATRGQHA